MIPNSVLLNTTANDGLIVINIGLLFRVENYEFLSVIISGVMNLNSNCLKLEFILLSTLLRFFVWVCMQKMQTLLYLLILRNEIRA